MVDDFGEKLMHNKEINLRKDVLNTIAFNRRLKFVNVYCRVKPNTGIWVQALRAHN